MKKTESFPSLTPLRAHALLLMIAKDKRQLTTYQIDEVIEALSNHVKHHLVRAKRRRSRR
jgi:hypothetical protein